MAGSWTPPPGFWPLATGLRLRWGASWADGERRGGLSSDCASHRGSAAPTAPAQGCAPRASASPSEKWAQSPARGLRPRPSPVQFPGAGVASPVRPPGLALRLTVVASSRIPARSAAFGQTTAQGPAGAGPPGHAHPGLRAGPTPQEPKSPRGRSQQSGKSRSRALRRC